MKRKIIFLSFVLEISLSGLSQTKKDVVGYVNSLIGTDSNMELSNGNTYPAIAMPWGMNFWTPQTGKMGEGWTYSYTANRIRGFKQTHQPSPWINDYGQFSTMPMTGEPVFDQDKRASWYNHKSETATPYYYRAYLSDYDVITEIVPTERAAMFQFTFPKNDHSYVVIDAFDNGSYVKIISQENKIIGYTTKNSGGVPDNFKNYFTITFDKPFTYKAAVGNNEIRENQLDAKENHAGAIIGFSTRKGEIVNARIASSFISFEQAELNLKELGKLSFEQLKQKGKARWNEVRGDEDNGQTSAWYVFSSLSFYPVCPGTDEYVLGWPLFKKVKINLENGKTIELLAPNNGSENRYIQEVTYNGQKYGKNYLKHSSLMKGAKIQLKMSHQPNYKRGTTKADYPYSLSDEKQ